ncbi:MAG: LCP family protein [Turicibacter sp.]|nr:LCP family protein [Turicibacter sp.]
MKRFKVLWVILGIFVFLIGGGYVLANYLIDSTIDKMVTTEKIDREEAEINEEVIEKEEESQVVNVAIFGVDKNGDQTDGRSDAMKILSLDAKNNIAKITSIQRDTLIYIPGVKQDYEKLNHAYAYGGANLAMQTINYNFDLDLTRYVTFNFEGVAHVIDAMGGIELEIKEYEVPYISNVSKSGYQHLSGEQALAYMRVRYADSDYVRMDRQTTVMKAMFSKLSTLSYGELLSLLNECLPYVETNLSKDDILSLGMQALKVDLRNIETYQVPRGGYDDINHSVSYNGYSPLYVMNSYQQMVKDLHQDIYGDQDYEPSQTVKETEAKIYEKFGYIEQ